MNASSLPTASRLLFDELLLQPNLRLRVGEHLVDIGALRIVTRPDHPRLTSKAAAVLIELVRHAGDTVMRDQLLDRVWADRVTTPDVLTQAIKELRRAFNDDAKPSRYIETIPKVGYRLLAPVSLLDAEEQVGGPGGVIAMAGNDPELFDAPVQPVVAAASLATTIGALLFLLFAREGPYPFGKAVFEPSRIGQVFREKPLLLANLGYLGHMWELYAMWAWLLAYTRAAFEAQAIGTAAIASLSTFFVVASGILGCLLGGYLSDRIGRTATTAGMMIVSGSCALLMGFLFTGPLWLFMLVAIVWGISVVGDSAQFSAAVTELADRRFVGTALSVQLGAGFALTVLAIWLTPHFADLIGGWRWAFLLLVPGPLLGAAAMLWLRNLPESVNMAGGLR